MMRVVALIMACLPIAGVSFADSLVATRMIRAQDTVTADAVSLVDADIPGAVTDPALAIGQEVRVTIYPGRAVLSENIGPPTLIDRNQIVPLTFRAGGLTIRTEGRALTRGAAGEMIEVMNLSSKTKVSGRIANDGGVEVGPSQNP